MPIPTKPIEAPRLTARERVYIALRDWITDGTLKPGEKISDLEISKYFSVSRTPVREAMQLLADQKLIEIFPGKESRVTSIDFDKIQQIYQMLAQLHGLAVQFAYPKVTSEVITKLDNVNELYKDSFKELNLEQIRANDKEFHEIFIQLSENDFLANFIEMLYTHVLRVENLYYAAQKDYNISIHEHVQIVNAIKNQNLAAAIEAMKFNWIHTAELISQIGE